MFDAASLCVGFGKVITSSSSERNKKFPRDGVGEESISGVGGIWISETTEAVRGARRNNDRRCKGGIRTNLIKYQVRKNLISQWRSLVYLG